MDFFRRQRLLIIATAVSTWACPSKSRFLYNLARIFTKVLPTYRQRWVFSITMNISYNTSRSLVSHSSELLCCFLPTPEGMRWSQQKEQSKATRNYYLSSQFCSVFSRTQLECRKRRVAVTSGLHISASKDSKIALLALPGYHRQFLLFFFLMQVYSFY